MRRGKLNGPAPPPSPVPDPNTRVTVDFGGQVVNADTGGPVEGVRISLLDGQGLPGGGRSAAIPYANDTATSGGDGTCTLPLNLPIFWRSVIFKLTAPPGYDDRDQRFEPNPICPCAVSWYLQVASHTLSASLAPAPRETNRSGRGPLSGVPSASRHAGESVAAPGVFEGRLVGPASDRTPSTYISGEENHEATHRFVSRQSHYSYRAQAQRATAARRRSLDH